jgi:predicted amidophosphoribosyltransferase
MSGPPLAGLDGFASVFAYEGVGRRLVLGLKFRNRRSDLTVFGPALAAAVASMSGPAVSGEVITWAPTTARRRRRRGYDQAQWLATALGCELGLPVRRLLVRLPSAPQTGASRLERLGQPHFSARRGCDRQSVLLVDDICTSGATLMAAAVALRRAGSENVVAVTLAQTSLNRAETRADTLVNLDGG